jgi:hypothetical protein
MASTARMFAAALLNSLGKGVEGYGEGMTKEREFALKKLTQEQDLIPPSVKEEAAISKLDLPQQQRIYDLKTASGGTKITVQPGGGIKKEMPPKDPSADEVKRKNVNQAMSELNTSGVITPTTRAILGENAARDLERAFKRQNVGGTTPPASVIRYDSQGNLIK